MKRNKGLIILAALITCALIYMLSGCKCPQVASTTIRDSIYVDKIVKTIKHDTVIQMTFCTDTVIQYKEVPVKVFISTGEAKTDTIVMFGFGTFRCWVDKRKLKVMLIPADTMLYKQLSYNSYDSLIRITQTKSKDTVIDECNSTFHSFCVKWFWASIAMMLAAIGLLAYTHFKK